MIALSLVESTHDELYEVVELLKTDTARALAVIFLWHEELKRGRTERVKLLVEVEALQAYVDELEADSDYE
jgi:hypothetical protein